MDRFNTPEVSQARQTAQQSSSTAAQAAQSAATLPDMLRDALTKKFEGSPLYGQRETALKGYLNTSTQAPLDVTHTSAGGNADVVYSPLQQANLIQGARANALAPITTLNSLLGLQYGGVDDIVDSSSRAAQAQVMGLQNQAQLDRQSYTDLVDLISRQADEDYRQQQLALQKQGNGDMLSQLSAIMSMLGIGTEGEENFWEDDGQEVMGPPGPPAPTAPTPIDLRGLNLSLGSGTGMGNIPLNTQPAKPKPKKESLPQFASWNQLIGM